MLPSKPTFQEEEEKILVDVCKSRGEEIIAHEPTSRSSNIKVMK